MLIAVDVKVTLEGIHLILGCLHFPDQMSQRRGAGSHWRTSFNGSQYIQFFWLTNYIETVISSFLWKPITSATTAFEYRKLRPYAKRQGTPSEFVAFQAHDFSFRGMSGLHDAVFSGFGSLNLFVGTDTVPAIDLAEDYYEADAEQELIGCSVPATECYVYGDEGR